MANKNKVLVKLEDIGLEWLRTHLHKEVLMIDENNKMTIIFCVYLKQYDTYYIKEKNSKDKHLCQLGTYFYDYDSMYDDLEKYQFYTIEKQHPKFYKNIVK